MNRKTIHIKPHNARHGVFCPSPCQLPVGFSKSPSRPVSVRLRPALPVARPFTSLVGGCAARSLKGLIAAHPFEGLGAAHPIIPPACDGGTHSLEGFGVAHPIFPPACDGGTRSLGGLDAAHPFIPSACDGSTHPLEGPACDGGTRSTIPLAGGTPAHPIIASSTAFSVLVGVVKRFPLSHFAPVHGP